MIKICIVLSLLVAVAQSAKPVAPTAFAATVGVTATLTPVAGSTLTLTCTKAPSGDAITGYKWLKDDTAVHTSSDTTDTAVFTINPVASGDNGVYSCKTTNGVGDSDAASTTQTIAVVPKCAPNEKIGTADCGCVIETAVDLPQTGGATNQVVKYCRLVGSSYSIETLETTECTENLKVVAGAECRARAATTDGTNYCVTGAYKSTDNVCTTFPSDNTAGCTKGADTKCLTCSDSMLTHCGTCNPGHDTPASTVCTACASGTFTAGGATDCATCTVCTSPKVEDTACTTAADRTCKWPCATGNAATDCTTCTAKNSRTKTNHCSACKAGSGLDAGACAACEAEKFSDGTSSCADCAAGKYSAAAASVCIDYTCDVADTATGCKTCITQASRTKTDHCSECKAGSGLDAGACAACEAEKFSDGASSCADCAAGKYSAAAASVCIAYTCATSTATTSCLTCKADADRTANDHCATCNKGYKISGKVCATDATSASSSMSLGVQTAVLIGMMNFV